MLLKHFSEWELLICTQCIHILQCLLQLLEILLFLQALNEPNINLWSVLANVMETYI